MRNRHLAVLAAVLALTGCAAVDSAMTRGGGAGLGAVRVDTVTGDVVPPGRGTTALALRAFVPDAEGGWQEVDGAVCHVTGGSFYRAVVATPVRLLVPDLGPDAPAIAAECRSGSLTGRAAVAPGFYWPAEGRPNSMVRIAWGQGWWWGYRKTGPMRYGDLAISLK